MSGSSTICDIFGDFQAIAHVHVLAATVGVSKRACIFFRQRPRSGVYQLSHWLGE